MDEKRLEELGLELKSYYDEEYEGILYWVEGLRIDSSNIIYYKTSKEAIEACLYPKVEWPSEEIMNISRHMNKVFSQIGNWKE